MSELAFHEAMHDEYHARNDRGLCALCATSLAGRARFNASGWEICIICEEAVTIGPNSNFASQDLVDRMLPKRVFGSGDTWITYDPSKPDNPYEITVDGFSDLVVEKPRATYTINWDHPSTKKHEGA